MPRLTNTQLAEYAAKLEAQLIELAAKVERLRMDLDLFVARWTINPPPPHDPGGTPRSGAS